MKAKAMVSELEPKFKSQAERNWDKYGWMYLSDILSMPVVHTFYEPMTFLLPGNKYTPDFLHIMQDGTMVFVEVKGSKKQKGYRDARSKLRMANEIHAWALWFEAIGKGDDWEVKQV